MIPEAITQDLQAGMGLEDTLIKHGTNLKELFSGRKRHHHQKHIDDWSWIRTTKYNTYRVSKAIDGKKIEFGTYLSHDDALLVRNELIKCNWDKTKLDEIVEKHNIQRNRPGGNRWK